MASPGMARPSPRLWRGAWTVDLRTWGFGQRYQLGGVLPQDVVGAVHAAYAVLERLRAERAAEPRVQLELAAVAGAPALFAAALDAWEARKEYATPGSRRYGASYARLVRRELGAYALADFAPPAGNDRLQDYIRGLRDRGLSTRTIRNRLSIAMQVLHNAARRGWAVCPEHPRLVGTPAPVFKWITEPNFRALRDAIYSGGKRCAPEHYARRRFYLSWLFYTGAHTADADALTVDLIFVDGGSFIRRNTKSAAVVPDEQFEMPEPLVDDLAELRRELGRDFLPGEALAGGPWPKVATRMGDAARRLGFPHTVNPRILRRSFAREMFQRGYSEQEVADRMGHVDLKMLHEVYVRTPRPAGRAHSRWKRRRGPSGAPPGNGFATVSAIR
jgi:integrase